jgi:hypothetical protein
MLSRINGFRFARDLANEEFLRQLPLSASSTGLVKKAIDRVKVELWLCVHFDEEAGVAWRHELRTN